jgi:cation:H+ antiporter
MVLWLGFIACTSAIVYSGTRLSRYGDIIAKKTGLGRAWIGVVLMASVTSLPEVVVSMAAVKMDAVDLAIGNLFGSNIFNILILAIDDIFFIKGPLLSFVNPNHIISALSAVAMTTIAIIGLTYRTEKKPLFLAWDSIGIVIVYFVNLMLLYMLK